MNNKEAAKALLEGKTLRIVNKTKQHQTYRFNKEAIGIELIGHDLFFNIHDFVSDNEWEEVKEPYKKEIITIDYLNFSLYNHCRRRYNNLHDNKRNN